VQPILNVVQNTWAFEENLFLVDQKGKKIASVDFQYVFKAERLRWCSRLWEDSFIGFN